MKKNPPRKDITALLTLAEYQVLTCSQLAILCFPSQQMARKKLRELAKAGLVEITHRSIGGSSGRPENVAYLSTKAVRILRELGEIDPGTIPDGITDIDLRELSHQLLINWIRIHLVHMKRQRSSLDINFLSPAVHKDYYQTSIDNPKLASSIIPDGIFSITDSRQDKSLLFFLEVDMGTETLSSSNPVTKDIRKKILCYQYMFRAELYKRFEELLHVHFRGFRILFVADTKSRFHQLCKLVESMPQTDFVWLADRNSMFESGISAGIWAKGGNAKMGCYSILGPSQAFKYSLEPLKQSSSR